MKNYFAFGYGLMVFFLAVLGVAAVGIGWGHYTAQSSYVKEKSRYDDAGRMRDVWRNSVQSRALKGKSAEAFLTVWEPYFVAAKDPTTARSAFNGWNLQLGLGLAPGSGAGGGSSTFTFPQRKSVLQGKSLDVTLMSVSLSGEYPRLINWLIQMEDMYPAVRMERIDFKTGEGALIMDVSLAFPNVSFDPVVTTTPAVKK
jgi:hypothetical protein